MDLLQFDADALYFEEPLPEAASQLIDQAASAYGAEQAEVYLLRAHLIAPEHLSVLVAVYRYYFYQHRLEEARRAGEWAMRVAARRLGLPEEWRRLDASFLVAAARSMGMLRFYLLALKAVGYINLRLGDHATATAQLRKVVDLDEADRLGAAALLSVVENGTHAPKTNFETRETADAV